MNKIKEIKMRSVLEFILKILTKAVLSRYKPDIVGITGSVGKTSTREAIYTVLSSRFNVRVNIKNYNNEIGLPLTILGLKSANRSVFGWIALFCKTIKLIIFRDHNFPEIIVLEMGVDRPGDMDYLNTIVKPKIAVITRIGSAHLEFFDSLTHVRDEKTKIFNNLPKDGWAIINHDDEYLLGIKNRIKQRVLSFGFSPESDLSANNIILSFEEGKDINSLAGVNFKIKYKGSYIPVLLPKVVSYTSIYASLAAAAVGFCFNMNGIEVSKALLNITPTRGRMNLIKGIKGSMIIDDTYNASPQSLEAALDIVQQIKLDQIKTKWIVLGGMLELGEDSEKEHLKAGKIIAGIPKAKLIVYGSKAKRIAEGAIKAGMIENNIYYFAQHLDIIQFLENEIKENDLILVKGSQGMRMEKVVKEIMEHKTRAESTLVRQEAEWQ
ncbi:MAG: UDP-N-acetylmuramoyl-tripeptide--D-alanyl-D-alanine ligase [bacterium]